MWTRTRIFATTIAAMLAQSGIGHAGTVTLYQGQDDGSGVGLPLASYTNSNAAFTAFQAGALLYGAIEQHGFGNVSNGFHDINFNNPTPNAGTIGYTPTTPNLGAGISGISDFTFGNLFGFGVGTGNDKWLGFPSGIASFSFSGPINSFGFWLTGLQGSTFGTTVEITLIDSDSVGHFLSPNNNNNGGAQFFGFTNTATFTGLLINATGTDYWGMDNVTFNSPSAVPIPAAFPLFAAGLGLMGLLGWRRNRKATAANVA